MPKKPDLRASTVPDRVITSAGDMRKAILDAIRGAEHRLSLSLFRCNDADIFEELTRAVGRGVAVEVITTARAKGGRGRLKKLWAKLGRTGAHVHMYADPVVKYHAKYLIADETAIVASLNFTRKCFTRTCDAIVITHDPDVVSSLLHLMAADREGQPLPGGISTRLIVGPERARPQFRSLIESAKESIRLIDAKLSDPDLMALLTERRAGGINVEIIKSKRLGELKSHGKVMLIDNRIAVVGSLALAALSLEFRREVAITVDDASAVADVEQLFTISRATTGAGPVVANAGGAAL